MPWQRWTAYLLATATVAANLIAWVWTVGLVGPSAVVPMVISSVVLLPVTALGLVVATLRPSNPVGALLVAASSAPMFIVVLEWAAGEVHRVQPDALVTSPLIVAVDQGAWMWLYVPGALLMLLFPDGHLLSSRWKWVAGGVVAVPVMFGIAAVFAPGPLREPFDDISRGSIPTLPSWLATGLTMLLPAFLILLIACAISMILRRRRSTDPILRAQVRWFAVGAMLLPVALLLCGLSYLLIGTPDLGFIVLAMTPPALAAATAIALLRHDLYDVDRALSLAVTSAVVSAVLLGLFVVVDTGLGLLLGGGSAAAAAAAAAVCAAALLPVTTRLQRSIGRRIDPTRAEVLDAIAALRVRADTGSEAPEELERVLRQSLRDPGLRIGYRIPGHVGMTDVSGAAVPTDSTRAAPVTQGGSVIGVVVPDSGSSSKELLRTVGREIAPVVEVIRLRQELAAAIRDVEASRHRLLTAGYEERRRLQRDLHDGAQQRLISLGVSLRLAQRHLEPGNEDLDGLFDQAVAELETSVAELRSISHGLGPATLRGGLASALHSLATSAPIAVDLDLECDDVPEDVAATAYYVANEALANALKHAGAQHASVVAHRQNGELTISVHDDGRGGADPRLGLGLAGLSDRVAATGGRFHIASADGDGTTVQAVIPCGS